MYYYVVHNGSTPRKKFFREHFWIYAPARGLIKLLGTNWATFSISSTEVHYYIVHSDCKLQQKFYESILDPGFTQWGP